MPVSPRWDYISRQQTLRDLQANEASCGHLRHGKGTLTPSHEGFQTPIRPFDRDLLPLPVPKDSNGRLGVKDGLYLEKPSQLWEKNPGFRMSFPLKKSNFVCEIT